MNKVVSLLSKKQNSLGSASFVLMTMVVLSALLGLISKRYLSSQFTTQEAGVFFAAFRLPNLLFDLLAMGTISSAFIPVFTKYLSKQREKEAHQIGATVMNITVVILCLLSIPILIWAEELSAVFAPGFSSQQRQTMAFYTRLMVIGQVFPLVIGNFITGILQSYNLFLFPAIAPVLYNAGMIFGVYFWASSFGILSAVFGVILGAFLFLFIQVPMMIFVGYKHSFSFWPRSQGVGEVFRLMIPRIFGLGVSQIDISVDLAMATLLGPKMVVAFYYAQSVQQLPVRLFGTTIAQAALPLLSSAYAKEEYDRFKQAIIDAFHLILFFVLPLSMLCIVLRIPIVRLLFGAEKFDWNDTVMTAFTLSAFAISIGAQAIVQLLTRGFFAIHNSRTPVVVGSSMVLLNAGLSAFFVLYLGMPVWALGISTSIASFLHVVVLLFLFRKKVSLSLYAVVYVPLKMCLAAILSGIIVYIPLQLLDQLVFDTTRVIGLFLLTFVTGVAGIMSYLFFAWVFDVWEIPAFVKMLERVKKIRSVFVSFFSSTTASDVAK